MNSASCHLDLKTCILRVHSACGANNVLIDVHRTGDECEIRIFDANSFSDKPAARFPLHLTILGSILHAKEVHCRIQVDRLSPIPLGDGSALVIIANHMDHDLTQHERFLSLILTVDGTQCTLHVPKPLLAEALARSSTSMEVK